MRTCVCMLLDTYVRMCSWLTAGFVWPAWIRVCGKLGPLVRHLTSGHVMKGPRLTSFFVVVSCENEGQTAACIMFDF